MKTLVRNTAALTLTLSLGAPLSGAFAASAHRTFDGTITHISTHNIKVKGREGGKDQELSFQYVPRFGKLHNGGKITTDQAKLHPGEYVRVIYDQKFLGMRHADAVEPQANPNKKLGN